MSKYSVGTNRTVHGSEISPDLAEYLKNQGHMTCERCQRPYNDVVNPFSNLNGKFGDYGISKINGCNGACSGPPKTWRFGNGASVGTVTMNNGKITIHN